MDPFLQLSSHPVFSTYIKKIVFVITYIQDDPYEANVQRQGVSEIMGGVLGSDNFRTALENLKGLEAVTMDYNGYKGKARLRETVFDDPRDRLHESLKFSVDVVFCLSILCSAEASLSSLKIGRGVGDPTHLSMGINAVLLTSTLVRRKLFANLQQLELGLSLETRNGFAFAFLCFLDGGIESKTSIDKQATVLARIFNAATMLTELSLDADWDLIDHHFFDNSTARFGAHFFRELSLTNLKILRIARWETLRPATLTDFIVRNAKLQCLELVSLRLEETTVGDDADLAWLPLLEHLSREEMLVEFAWDDVEGNSKHWRLCDAQTNNKDEKGGEEEVDKQKDDGEDNGEDHGKDDGEDHGEDHGEGEEDSSERDDQHSCNSKGRVSGSHDAVKAVVLRMIQNYVG